MSPPYKLIRGGEGVFICMSVPPAKKTVKLNFLVVQLEPMKLQDDVELHLQQYDHAS